MPRRPVPMEGISIPSIPVSLTITASHARRSARSRRKLSRFVLPTSSSPSMHSFTLTGIPNPPWRRVSRALMCMWTCPLSSFVPRAYIRPSRTSGSNGGESQSSTGSTDCTS